MNKEDMLENTHNAFDFVEKLYLESTYLIKEVEGMLVEEEEEFIIGKPGGYQVTFLGSKGLEQRNVTNWLPKSMAVFFVPKSDTTEKAGVTVTRLDSTKKAVYLRISLYEKEYKHPKIFFGVLGRFKKNNESNKWPTKVEDLIGHFEYYKNSFFSILPEIRYETLNVNVYGKLDSVPLFNVNNSEDIKKLVVNPALKLYRGF